MTEPEPAADVRVVPEPVKEALRALRGSPAIEVWLAWRLQETGLFGAEGPADRETVDFQLGQHAEVELLAQMLGLTLNVSFERVQGGGG